MASSLDRFPPEIFCIIFEHLWAHEIVSAFHNINVHLNRILASYNGYLVNLKSIRKSYFDLITRCIRPEQIIGLILSDERDTPYQSQLFQSYFSIEECVHLRTLKFLHLDDDGQSFFTDLPELEHLKSFQIDVKIMLPLVTIPLSVERLVINIRPNFIFDVDPSISMIAYERLRYLSVCHCSCEQLKKILAQAVQLTSLKVVLPLLTDEEFDTFINFHRKQIRVSPLISLSLSVSGAGHTIMQTHLEQFLAPWKDLRRLELITKAYGQSQLTDGIEWERFVLRYLPRLSKFDFNFSCRQIDPNVINAYRRPFWIDRHWYVLYETHRSVLYTVPRFVPSSVHPSCHPISPNCTTLPIEQHSIFYDAVNELRVDSKRYELPFRYTHVQTLTLDGVFANDIVSLFAMFDHLRSMLFNGHSTRL